QACEEAEKTLKLEAEAASLTPSRRSPSRFLDPPCCPPRSRLMSLGHPSLL
ncbi:hypothetical protein F444_04410, partial [Phytophthora nicotianae P1976]